jgi:mannosyltransferase
MNDEYSLEELAPWVAGAITLIGGLLRIFQLGTKGMWLDETFSVWLANQGVGDMLQWIVKIDQHPPLYYFLLHYWVALYGDTPYAARLLSVLFGTATIPIMYLIGKRLSGPVMGLVAAVLLAFSVFNIFYAQEARMYTLLAFNAAVAIYALACLLTDPRAASPIGSQLRGLPQAWRTQRWSAVGTVATDLAWIALIVFSAATLLTHNTAVFFVLATNLFVLGLLLYQRIKKGGTSPALQAPPLANWVKAQIGIFLLWCLWIAVFVRQAARVYQEFWIPQPTWDRIVQTLRVLLNASAQGQVSQVVILWVLGFVLCLGVVYYHKKLSILLLLVTLFAVPFVGELIVSIRRPIFYDRTLIWITIPLLLLLAAGILQLRFRLLMILAVGAIMTNYLFSAGDYYRFFQKEDWATAAGHVAYFAKQDDLVLFNSNFVEIPFDYYFRPYEDQYSLRVVKQGVPLDLLGDGVLEPKMTEGDIPKLAELVSEHDRIWLVYSHDSYTDPKGLIPQTLAAQKKLTSTREFYGGQVQLYETP